MSDPPLVNQAELRQVMEHYMERGWTDGLPVMPVTRSYLDEFLAHTDRDPGETLLEMQHLDRRLTVELAALNAALAGCRPEYLPVVLAAWEALKEEGLVTRGIWQSTTGTAPLLLVNGPVRHELGFNSAANVFGSGYRANATVGRAIRLTAINVFGLRPGELDQATQGTPAKYSACIAENEEASPWPPFHVEHGYTSQDSTVTALTCRSVLHLEARHTPGPEPLALDLANTIARTGAHILEHLTACIVLGPEHARLFADAGWDRAQIRRFVYAHAVNSRDDLVAVGKDAVSSKTRWRLPSTHPEAVDAAAADVPALRSEQSLQIVVAGAGNAGVSAVIETFGLRAERPPIALIR